MNNFQFLIKSLWLIVKSQRSIVALPGFSLIELLVVIGIIGTVSSLSFAAFSSFSKTQAVKTAAIDVSALLQSAKSQALSQVKPTQCGNLPLEGYRVAIIIAGSVYRRDVLCGGTFYTIETKNLPANVSFANGSASAIVFRIISGSVASPGAIILSGYGQTQTITVNTTGSISIQ